MSYRLVLLGLLAEQSRYGYDLKQTIAERNFAEYVPLSGGGLYYHLRKLKSEGLIEESNIEREGNYPDRHVYRITDQGRAYFLELLRNTMQDVKGRRHYDPIDPAMAFGSLLEPVELIARLQRQIDLLRARLSMLEALHTLQLSLPQYVDLWSDLIVEHAVHRLRSSIEWLQTAIRRIGEVAASTPDRLLAPAELREKHAEQAGLPLDTYNAVADPYAGAFSASAAQRYGEMRAAEARYRDSLDEAWRQYEAGLQAGHEALPDALRVAYEARVAAAWQEYASTLEMQREAALAEFAATDSAFKQALNQAKENAGNRENLPKEGKLTDEEL